MLLQTLPSRSAKANAVESIRERSWRKSAGSILAGIVSASGSGTAVATGGRPVSMNPMTAAQRRDRRDRRGSRSRCRAQVPSTLMVAPLSGRARLFLLDFAWTYVGLILLALGKVTRSVFIASSLSASGVGKLGQLRPERQVEPGGRVPWRRRQSGGASAPSSLPDAWDPSPRSSRWRRTTVVPELHAEAGHVVLVLMGDDQEIDVALAVDQRHIVLSLSIAADRKSELLSVPQSTRMWKSRPICAPWECGSRCSRRGRRRTAGLEAYLPLAVSRVVVVRDRRRSRNEARARSGWYHRRARP